MKRNDIKGFTLVEAIIVVVIMLILSAIGIPMYQGYVKDARYDGAKNLAETTAAAANSYYRKTGDSTGLDADTLRIFYDKKKYTVAINDDGKVIVSDTSRGSPVSDTVSWK